MRFINTVFLTLLILALPFPVNGNHLLIKEPGTLHTTYEKRADKTSKSLKITGRLNNADVAFLRLICGSDNKFKPVDTAVSALDLTDVEFVPEADSIVFAGKKYRITSPHAIAPFMFYGTDLDEIILPAKTDSIFNGALTNMPIRKLEIPQGVYVSRQAVATDSLLTELHLPAMSNAPYFTQLGLPKLKKIHIGDTDYVMSGSFADMPELEEVCFEGLVGHIDGYQFANNPKLRKVSFKGPIVTTGGPVLAEKCPAIEEYEFNDLVASFGFVAPEDAPAFKGIKSRYGALIETSDSVAVPLTPADKLTITPEIISSAKKIVDFQTKALIGNDINGFLTRIAGMTYDGGLPAQMAVLGIDTASYSAAYKKSPYKDLISNKLELLKASAPYKPQPELQIEFRYAPPTDSLLTLSRQLFNLDSIAGNGPASERIKNLTYWVHDLIRHDGSSGMPEVLLTLPQVVEVCKKENRGVNCRGLAIILTEALLAEGIPARYLTCESKAYNYDNDCHVICAAWADDLGKWVWADPTFAAFVTDENGLMLHPGEVRQRLIDGKPLVLNEDANWNHDVKQTKEQYLEQYMAKNLYLIQAIQVNRAGPEGKNSDPDRRYISLVPEGFNYDRNPANSILTTDYDLFWQPPVKR